MADPERLGRSAAMVAAQKHRHEATSRRAADALRRLQADGDEVSFTAVALAAGISRAWLYRDPELRAGIDRIRTGRQPVRAVPRRPVAEQASYESLRELRASLQAELNALREENRRLRDALARKLGEGRSGRPAGQE